MPITKIAKTYFAHTTSKDSLDKMLDSGRIYSVRHLAEKDPDKEVSVQTLPGLPFRRKLNVRDAYEKMRSRKNPDKIFLTRDSYVPSYGDRVIVKDLKHPKEREGITTIPNEYHTRRPLSLKSNARMFVPDDEMSEYKQRYKGYKFSPISQIPLKDIKKKDQLKTLATKLTKTSEFDENFIRRNISTKGMLVGSEALGTNIPGKSDTDVFIPYKHRGHFDRSINRLQKRYPDLRFADTSKGKEHKRVLTGEVGGKPVDITVAYGEPAERFGTRFQEVKSRITPEKREEIRNRKEKLKNAWLFPEYRYNRYKKKLSDGLGLKEVYF